MSDENNRGIDHLDSDLSTSPNSNLRTNHLLLIGIDDYSNGIRKLKNAVKDATDFRNILLKKYQFEKENIIELLNENATQDNISETIRSLATKLTKSDNLIIFFAGHGIYDEVFKEGYWIGSRK